MGECFSVYLKREKMREREKEKEEKHRRYDIQNERKKKDFLNSSKQHQLNAMKFKERCHTWPLLMLGLLCWSCFTNTGIRVYSIDRLGAGEPFYPIETEHWIREISADLEAFALPIR